MSETKRAKSTWQTTNTKIRGCQRQFGKIPHGKLHVEIQPVSNAKKVKISPSETPSEYVARQTREWYRVKSTCQISTLLKKSLSDAQILPIRRLCFRKQHPPCTSFFADILLRVVSYKHSLLSQSPCHLCLLDILSCFAPTARKFRAKR